MPISNTFSRYIKLKNCAICKETVFHTGNNTIDRNNGIIYCDKSCCCTIAHENCIKDIIIDNNTLSNQIDGFICECGTTIDIYVGSKRSQSNDDNNASSSSSSTIIQPEYSSIFSLMNYIPSIYVFNRFISIGYYWAWFKWLLWYYILPGLLMKLYVWYTRSIEEYNQSLYSYVFFIIRADKKAILCSGGLLNFGWIHICFTAKFYLYLVILLSAVYSIYFIFNITFGTLYLIYVKRKIKLKINVNKMIHKKHSKKKKKKTT